MSPGSGEERTRHTQEAAPVAGCLSLVLLVILFNIVLFWVFVRQSGVARARAVTLAAGALNGAKVAVFMAALYVYLPGRIIPFGAEDAPLDRLFGGFAVMASVMAVIVHALAILNLYDWVSAWLSIAGVVALGGHLRSRLTGRSTGQALRERMVYVFADVLDAADNPWTVVSDVLVPLARTIAAHILSLSARVARRVVSLDGLVVAAAFAWPAYMRFHYPLTNASYTYGDPYVHLAWMKYMTMGLLYRDGIYPHGMHAVLSILEKAAFLDPYWIVRFAGAVFGALMVLSVFHAVLRATGDIAPAALASFIYGVEIGLPAQGWRQCQTMPQEMAAVCFLPGLVFLADYLATGRRTFRWLYLAAYFVTLVTHPFAAFYLLVGTACMLLVAVFSRSVNAHAVMRLAAGGLVVSAVGTLPYSIGLMLRKPFHSVSWALRTQILEFAPGAHPLDVLRSSHPITVISLVGAALCVLAGFAMLVVRKREPRAYLGAGCALSAIVLYVMAEARSMGLPQLVEPLRTREFFSLAAAVAMGLLAGPLLRIAPRTLRGLGTAMLCAAVVVWVQPKPYVRELIEYSISAEMYLNIKRDFPTSDWTLVAPVEQYQQVLGRGWHFEIWRFAREFSPGQVRSAGFRFPIPTTHVLIMVEKVPFGSEGPVGPEMAEEDLPLATMGETDFYYRDRRNRAIVQARAIAVCEAYRSTHPDTTIYYEDDLIRVYHVPNPVRATGAVD